MADVATCACLLTEPGPPSEPPVLCSGGLAWELRRPRSSMAVRCATICLNSENEVPSGNMQLEVSGFMRLKRAEQSAVGLLPVLQTAAHVDGKDVKGAHVDARVTKSGRGDPDLRQSYGVGSSRRLGSALRSTKYFVLSTGPHPSRSPQTCHNLQDLAWCPLRGNIMLTTLLGGSYVLVAARAACRTGCGRPCTMKMESPKSVNSRRLRCLDRCRQCKYLQAPKDAAPSATVSTEQDALGRYVRLAVAPEYPDTSDVCEAMDEGICEEDLDNPETFGSSEPKEQAEAAILHGNIPFSTTNARLQGPHGHGGITRPRSGGKGLWSSGRFIRIRA